MVSGTFDSPNRGAFHLSVALLSTIGRDVVLSLGEWAPQLRTGFHVHRATLERQPQRRARGVAYGTITLYREPFQTLRLPLPL